MTHTLVTTTTQRCSRPPWATSLTVGLTTCRDDRYTSRYKAKLFSHATLHYVAFTAGTTNQSLPTGLLLAGLPAFLWAFKATNTRTQQHAVSSRVSLGDCQTTSQCHQNLQKRKILAALYPARYVFARFPIHVVALGPVHG